MMSQTGLNPLDEIDNQLREKGKKEEIDSKNELEQKQEAFLKIQNILKLPKGNKSNEDLKFIFNYFRDLKFFRIGLELYGKNTLINLLDCCSLIELPENDIVINLGDSVKSAFILVSGNIKISSLNKHVTENNEDRIKYKTSDKINKTLNLFLYKTLKNVKGNKQYNLGHTIEMLHGNHIRFLKPKHEKAFNMEDDWKVELGELFGDKYLIERKTSSLSFVSTQKCVLLEIKKKDFYNLLEPIRKEEYLKELKFFHSISVFSKFSRNAIERLKLNLKEKKYFNGELVLEQNQPINDVFIVKSGSFQVTYKYSKNIVNVFDLNYYSNITPLDFRFTENRRHEIKGYKKTEENLKLLTVEKGQFIGDLEFIQNREKSYFKVTCIHEGSVLISIPRIIFDKYLSDQKEDFYDFTKERQNYYKERLKISSEISKAICFDNPETKHLKDLIIRIKDGMQFIKKQEKKQSESKTKYDNASKKFNSQYSIDISTKAEKINEANCGKANLKKAFYRESMPKDESDDDDFLKNYNRTGDYNEKIKKIKRNIFKRDSIDLNNETKSVGKLMKVNGRNKSALPLQEIQKGFENVNKEDEEGEDGLDLNELNKNENFLINSSQKLNRLNSANLILNNITKNSEAKIDHQINSFGPKKVVELFTHLKNASILFKEKNATKNDSAENTSNTLFSALMREGKLASSRELNPKENSSAFFNFKSALKNENQEKDRKTFNHSSVSFKNINESDSRTNFKMFNFSKDNEKDTSSFYGKSLMKKNKSLITHKIKIRKIALEDWKKQSSNPLNNSIELFLNTQRRKETSKKMEFCNPCRNISDLIQMNKLPSTLICKSDKLSEIKPDEQIKTPNNLMQYNNNNINEKYQIASINNSPKLNNFKKNTENKNNNNNNNLENNVNLNNLNINTKNQNDDGAVGLLKNSPNRKIQEQSTEEIKIVLNTINREIGEFNNDLYVIDNGKIKNENENQELNSEENHKKRSKSPFIGNINDKSCSTTNINQVLDQKSEFKDRKLNENSKKTEEQKQQINKFIRLKLKSKAENNIKRGISAEVGSSKILNTIEIKDIWNKRKTEIFNNIESKRIGFDANKLFIKSTKIKPNFAVKKNSSPNKKQLYCSNKNPNLSNTKYETPDVNLNISVFLNENFEKDKSIFKIKDKKDLLETSEISKSIFLNSNKISKILNSKYDYLRSHCSEKKVEKSINLRKKD